MIPTVATDIQMRCGAGGVLEHPPGGGGAGNMRVIQPTTRSMSAGRYTVAYPGIEYSVPLAVVGKLPLTYTVNSPAGGSVDSKGVLRFIAPTSGIVDVDIDIVDADGATVNLAWSVSVDAAQFLFIDPAAAPGGDGTINAPYQQIADVWPGNAGTAGKFVYLRGGTHQMPDTLDVPYKGTYHITIGTADVEGFIGYPGESAVIDQLVAGKHVTFRVFSRFFIGSLTTANTLNNFVFVENGDDIVLFDLTDAGSSIDPLHDNLGYFQILNDQLYNGVVPTSPPPDDGNNSYRKRNLLMQCCTLHNQAIPSVEMYGCADLGAFYNDITMSPGCYTALNGKSSSSGTVWFGNTIRGDSGSLTINSPSQAFHDDLYIAFNDVRGGDVVIGGFTGPKNVTLFRNTLFAPVVIRSTAQGDGPINIDWNVIVNDFSAGTVIDASPNTTDHIASDPTEHWSISADVTVMGQNLLGYPADNIVDANNRLIDRSLVGVYGYEV